VIYVEDDPALCGIVVGLLKDVSILEICDFSNSKDALVAFEKNPFDVALLDISLGTSSLTGVELAHRFRKISENVGIVFFSQYSDVAIPRPDDDYFMGWSTIQKSAQINIPHLVEVLLATAKGFSRVERSMESSNANPTYGIENLTTKQHGIMSLIAEGFDANYVASKFSLAPVTIRQELSRIYKILVPNPTPGTDLRTSAVVRYLRVMTEFTGGKGYQ
jgi:DNA-binding NarL/FixJ family response regulator